MIRQQIKHESNIYNLQVSQELIPTEDENVNQICFTTSSTNSFNSEGFCLLGCPSIKEVNAEINRQRIKK